MTESADPSTTRWAPPRAARQLERDGALGDLIEALTADPFSDHRSLLLDEALQRALDDQSSRHQLVRALARVYEHTPAKTEFRERVCRPIVEQLLNQSGSLRVTLASGLMLDITSPGRIELAVLLSVDPDHVWEPQTTRLLEMLAAESTHSIVGGAYIGDQVLPMSLAAAAKPAATIHAFEPSGRAYVQLLHNLGINGISNVTAHHLALWSESTMLQLKGTAPLASTASIDDRSDCAAATTNGLVAATTIDEYAQTAGLTDIGLIMLDTEGGEEPALRGARTLLARPPSTAPQVIFEVHRQFVDWTVGLANTPVVQLLAETGYAVYAIRDFHANRSMAGRPIEVIPVDRVYLEGPPHGFNLLATKEATLIRRLRLEVVNDVSPKLLADRDPRLHHPLGGL